VALATGYYLANYQKPRKEITMIEFINQYVLREKVKEIFVTKDPRSEVFNFRADIDCQDGEQLYMILSSYDEFLQKLEVLQHQMGKQPSEVIPIKFSGQENNTNGTVMNVAVGAMFLFFFYSIFKGRNGNMSTGLKKGKPKDSSSSDKKGGFFGGGGMNDMFGMGKSNAKQYGGEEGIKIKTRFKHVAGNEGAKEEIMEFVDFLKDPKKY
jgi:ATP-dependent Zn protease